MNSLSLSGKIGWLFVGIVLGGLSSALIKGRPAIEAGRNLDRNESRGSSIAHSILGKRMNNKLLDERLKVFVMPPLRNHHQIVDELEQIRSKTLQNLGTPSPLLGRCEEILLKGYGRTKTLFMRGGVYGKFNPSASEPVTIVALSQEDIDRIHDEVDKELGELFSASAALSKCFRNELRERFGHSWQVQWRDDDYKIIATKIGMNGEKLFSLVMPEMQASMSFLSFLFR